MAKRIISPLFITVTGVLFILIGYAQFFISAYGWQESSASLRATGILSVFASLIVIGGAFFGLVKSDRQKTAWLIVLCGIILFALTRVALWVIYKEPVLL